MSIKNFVQKLSKSTRSSALKDLSILIGFDGFTDEVVRAVRSRTLSSYETIGTIAEFIERLTEAKGKSTNFELITQQVKIGGNGPILAQALCSMGFRPTLIGALGDPDIEPLFLPLLQQCRQAFSLAPSGHTTALEFHDGKLLLGKHESIFSITKEKLTEKIPVGILKELIESSDIFASVNWTMLVHTTEIWQFLLETILPSCSIKKRLFFVDLADPKKRSAEDLRKALKVIKEFQRYFHIVLGLNELEATRLQELYERSKSTKKQTLQKTALSLLEKTGFDEIVIHTATHAYAASKSETTSVTGPFCKEPLLLTGGGDSFNAGYLTGYALGFNLEERLLIAAALAGFYVRNAKSPTMDELIDFLKKWKDE